MVYYWLRLMYLYIGARFFWKRVNADETVIRNRRVSILDCEAFIHMSNAKYIYYMDFIRYELLFRSNLYENTAKKGMFAVLGSQKIIYKKPLKRWSKFTVSLELVGWDDKWAYHRQVFKQGDQISAIGYTKLTFLKHKKVQDMNAIMEDCNCKPKANNSLNYMKYLFDQDHHLLNERYDSIP